MTVRTLSLWVDRLLSGPVTIECPYMKIIGRDHEPPVFTGSGYIKIEVDTRMRFVMHGTPDEGSEVFRRVMEAKKNPYDVLQQFRVQAEGYDGTKWNGGWTTLHVGDVSGNVWHLSGPVNSLSTSVEGFGVSGRSGVELVYDRPLRLPLPMNMVKTVFRDDKQVLLSHSGGAQAIEVLGTKIEFLKSPQHEHVWAVAETSPALSHPYLENWLSEPLNLLLGEIISPRLQARNLGNGKALIVLRPASGHSTKSLAACILREDPLGAGERFWSLYRDILTVVATARDSSGNSSFEAHSLTRYYWEIIQATKGSNWVLCMTLASTVEGIVKMMFSEAERKSDWSESEVDNLKKVVKDWNGDESLRGVVLNYLIGFKTKGIAKTLKSLVDEGVVTKDQVGAWSKLRHSSMHGGMVMPWSDEEQDARIENLISLTHRLSEAYIKRELGKVA